MKRTYFFAAGALAAAAALSACGARSRAPGPAVESRIAPLIVDATRGGGTPAFHWIPPMTTTAAAFTTLDQTGAANALTVRVDRLYPDFSIDPAPKTSFTGTAIRMVTGTSDASFPGVTGPFYGVNWAAGMTVASGQSYRISVQASSNPTRVLGVADVQIVATSTAAGQVDRTKFTPLVAGSTLAIVFRLEAKDTDADGVNDWRDNCPVTKNANQLDGNRDGRGDACQCLNVPNGTACGTSCRTGQSCQSGACTGGTAAANGTACGTGNACKTGETCTSGTCGGGSNRATGTTCSTGNACKTGETCTSGTCGGGSNRATGTACSTGNACKTGETCTSGTCGGGSNRATGTTCSTGNACKTGQTCTSGACGGGSNRANGTACGDGDLCTQTDTCQSGVCTGGAPVTCATDTCHNSGTCDKATGLCPARKADGTTCSDGNACTRTDTCQAGACTGTNPITCAAPDQCHTAGTCNTSTGVCSNPAKANGATCSDGNACTQTDSCQAGVCAGVNPKVCTALDVCHAAGMCDATSGACSNPLITTGTCGKNPYEYDGAGRLIRDGDAILTYDGYDRLVQLTPAAAPTPQTTAGRPAVPMRHTYGYDGQRTSTITNVGLAGQTTDYWFGEDYAERSDGRRDHYLRVGARVVARVTFRPPPGAAAVASKLADGGDRSRRQPPSGPGPGGAATLALGLAFLALLASRRAPRAQTLRRRRAAAALATVALTAALLPAISCETFTQQSGAATVWNKVQELYVHQGTAVGPSLITDASGAVFEERRYEPFGAPIDAFRSATGTGTADFQRDPRNALNKETDSTTEWSYHGARWMAPQTARWSTPDPAVKSPDPRHLLAPWDLNPYAYAAGNPLLFWDPDGQRASWRDNTPQWAQTVATVFGAATVMDWTEHQAQELSQHPSDNGVRAKAILGAPAVAYAHAKSTVNKAEALVHGLEALNRYIPGKGPLGTHSDEAVFWSGISDPNMKGENKAERWAAQHGGKTLEMTLKERGVTLPIWDPNNPAITKAWHDASMTFAQGAKGDIRVLLRDPLRPGAVWSDEFEALKQNDNVTSVTSINPDTGQETRLWKR